MSGAVAVRGAEAHDLPAIVEIEKATFSRPWTRETFASVLEHAEADLLVATDGRTVVGYAVLLAGGAEAELANLAVSAGCRKRGVREGGGGGGVAGTRPPDAAPPGPASRLPSGAPVERRSDPTLRTLRLSRHRHPPVLLPGTRRRRPHPGPRAVEPTLRIVAPQSRPADAVASPPAAPAAPHAASTGCAECGDSPACRLPPGPHPGSTPSWRSPRCRGE